MTTTLWTFFISKKFIQGTVFLHHSTSEKSITIHKHVYMHRIKKFRIFSTLLIVTSLTYLPGILAAMIAVFWNTLPIPAFSTVVVLFLLNPVLNPIVQFYFKRDTCEFIVHYCIICVCNYKKPKMTCSCINMHSH